MLKTAVLRVEYGHAERDERVLKLRWPGAWQDMALVQVDEGAKYSRWTPVAGSIVAALVSLWRVQRARLE